MEDRTKLQIIQGGWLVVIMMLITVMSKEGAEICEKVAAWRLRLCDRKHTMDCPFREARCTVHILSLNGRGGKGELHN